MPDVRALEATISALTERIQRLEGRLASQDTIGHQLELAQAALIDLTSKKNGVLMPMDASWVLTCATLVFLMQLGFAQLEAGTMRQKNVVAT